MDAAYGLDFGTGDKLTDSLKRSLSTLPLPLYKVINSGMKFQE